MKVLLFDIDGTLIRSGGAGKIALEQALNDCFNLENATADIDYGGRTDFSIVRELLELNGVDYSEGAKDKLLNTYCSLLPDIMNECSSEVLPGVFDLLDRLKDNSDYALGILTGNLKHGADTKLKLMGLDSYFSFGGYGDHAESRNLIAEQAVRDAKRHLTTADLKSFVVIGDTPKDVECAKHVEAVAVAVATGYASRDSVIKSEPDYFLEDLSDTDRVMSIFAGA